MKWSKKAHSVITPSDFARKLRYRHTFDRRNAEIAQTSELANGGDESAFGSESADMEFV